MVSIGINSGVFSSQNTIISVNFGSNCTFVGGNAFKDCVSLFEINNNNIIKNIHSSAFANTKIYSATFDNLISLGVDAFRGCSNLSYISIPICPEIASGTFYGCSNLSSINIPIFDKFTIGNDAFVNCTNLKTVNIDKNITGITIGNNAFKNCTNLKDINFNNFDKIGDCAFQSCKSLNKIILHKCSEIGSSAFKDCENLKKVYIYKTDEICTLGRSAFHISGNSYPTFYIHPDIYGSYISVTSNNTWYNYKDNMIKMVDNNQIIYTTSNNTIIGNINGNINDNKYTNTYENGYGLIEFDENVKVETLNEILFKNQTTLKTVDLPESCKNIEDNAFNGCENLSDIKLSDSLEKIGNFAFQNCKSLTSFTIPQSVTTLGEGIFAGCENIEKFEGTFASNLGSTIVYGSTLICVSPNDNNIKLSERGRFYDISKINQNITRLGNSCFCGCKNMIRVNIPSNIKSIGNYAFKDCENLREIHFYGDPPEIMNEHDIFPQIKDGSDFKIFVPENKLIDYCSANGFEKYIDYIYPMPIGANIIYYCSANAIKIPNIKAAKIEHSNIPNGNYYRIPKLVSFENCDVTQIITNENIKTIADKTFSGCKSLEYIYLSDGITRLGTRCFNDCKSLKSIHIPRGNNLLRCNFGDDIFLGCKNLKKFVSFGENISEDGRCYIDNLTGELKFFAQGELKNNESGKIEYIIPYNVKKIGRSAFRNSDITSITFNESIKEIDKFAFMECNSLNAINNLSNIKTISDGAFSDCKNLGKISLPNSLTTIGKNAFKNCISITLTSSDISATEISATEIGEYAFYNCANIKSKLILQNITNINTSTFYGCNSLESVDVNDNVKTICDNAFYNCTNLSAVNISNSSELESIGASAFRNCSRLSTFNLSKNATKLKTIGEYAFMGCSNYGNIDDGESPSSDDGDYTIPDSLTYNGLGKYCFYGTAIEKLCISSDSSLEIIPNNAFSNCTNLSEVDIQSSKLMSINSYAFSNCTNLSKVDISNSSLESIDSYAFYNCEVLGKININLPNTINSIGDYAFYNCKISDITLPKHPSLSLGTNCFDTQGVNKITVIIPNELVFPPIFKTANATPFGNPSNTLKSIKIKTPPILYNVYKTDKYWKIYENNIFLYIDPNSDSPVITPT